MAEGLPDYYRGVDIAYQALAELQTRPKYGAGLAAFGSVVTTGWATTVLATISGKGMLYGGYVYLDYTSSQKGSYVIVALDGTNLVAESFGTMNQYRMTRPLGLVNSILKYDDVNYQYAVGLAYGFTFETELKLSYFEGQGNAPTVTYRLVYAVI